MLPEKQTAVSHALSAQKIFHLLKTQPEGLSAVEVAKRHHTFGPNRLPEPPRASTLKIFLSQFKSSFIIILMVAALISYGLGDHIDAGVIIAAVAINVILGFVQEAKAQRALEQLRKIVTYQAIVFRGGREQTVATEMLVPGDIVVLNAGDKIPADMRLFSVQDLEINEAALTGESAPAEKNTKPLHPGTVLAERTNMVYTGTVVTKGSGRGIVMATGSQTEIGQIAALLKSTPEMLTPLQRKLGRFSRWLATFVLILSALITVFGYSLGIPFVEIFTIAVALAVAAIPEGLIVSVTVILAISMQRILKRHGLVRKLVAAETLGSATVICTDKTGTLTTGQMQVVKIITSDNDFLIGSHQHNSNITRPEHFSNYMRSLEIGVISNDAFIINPQDEMHDWKVMGNLTERALLMAGIQVGIDTDALRRKYSRLAELPFDSERKFMATLHKDTKQKNIMFIKGAPEKILHFSKQLAIDGKTQTLSAETKQKLERKFSELSRQGLRILALAYKTTAADYKHIEEKDITTADDFVFLSFIGIKDPLRANAKRTVKAAQKSGIRVVMITGDNRLTAQAIATELGLPAKMEAIMEGEHLTQISDAELARNVRKYSVYARVTPQDKLRIVKAWQSHGEVVAMTGDGVNDSPAMKKADIGVALGSGTAVTKETADLVILDDNFETIVHAVEEGRSIFDNIRKVTLYLLSDSFSEIILVVLALIAGIPLPLAAVQILWINLVTDGFPNLALTVEPKEAGIMEEKPVSIREPLLHQESRVLIALISVVMGISNFALFYWYWHTTGDIELSQTMVFASLGVNSLIYVFSIRSLRRSIFQQKIFSNMWLVLAVFGGLFLQLGAIYLPFLQNIVETVPLGINAWGIIAILSVINISIIEIVKRVYTLENSANSSQKSLPLGAK